MSARLVRGAGRADVGRLVMMAVGMGLSVAALLIAVAVPRALGAASNREAARAVVWGDPRPSSEPFVVDSSTTAAGDGLWTQVRLRGGDARSPIPPGLDRLPDPGHTVVSMALRQLLDRDPRLAGGLGIVDPVALTDAGIIRPGELLSYTRTADAAGRALAAPVATESGPGSTVVAFGDRSVSAGFSASLGLEAMLLVALPALLFLSVCARLSLSSRRARLASLRLIGVSQDRCARIYSGELALVSSVGAVAGVVCYQLTQSRIAGGILGVTWFPTDTRLNLPGAVAVVLLSIAATAAVARRAMLRVLAAGEARERRRSWPAHLGVVLMLVGGTFLAVVVVKTFVAAPSDPVLAPSVHMQLTMGACLATLSGILLALPPLVVHLGEWLSTAGVPASVRLGARLAAAQGGLHRQLLGALVVTVMASGLSSAFLFSTYLDAVGDPNSAVLAIDLQNAPISARRAVARDLPPDAEVFVLGTDTGTGGKVDIHVMSCKDYVRKYDQAEANCVPGPVRVGDDAAVDTINAGADVRIAQLEGAAIDLAAPAHTIGGLGGLVLVIPPADAPWAITAPDALVTVTVPSDQAVAIQARLQGDAPTAAVQRLTKDSLSLARYVEQSAVLRSSLALAYLLCLLTFVFSMTEARWAAERTLVAQRAMGVPAGVTRRATLVQAMLPIAAGVVIVLPAVACSGIAFLAYWGAGNARDLTLWTPTALLALGAVALTGAVGWLLGRAPLNLEALAD